MAQAYAADLLLADDAAGTTNPIRPAFLTCDFLGNRTFGRDEGHRGTRQRYACRSRVTQENAGGSMAGRLAAAEIDWIIERALGDTTLAVTTPTDAGPAEFYALVDKVESNWRYDKLRINRLVITIQEGQYLNWQIECVGEDETDITTTWPASPPSITCGLAFIAADATFKLGATAYPFKSLTLTIDNFVNSIYENSATPTQFEAEDLAVTVSGTFAYRSDTKALYKTALAGDTGTIVLADGTTTYTIAFPNLKLPNNGPTVPQQGEITMNLDMEAFHEDDATSTADVIKITKS